MSGHSKWANIQHRKGVVDKKRSETFTRLSRDILTALRSGSSLAVRSAVDRARAADMPKDNIERLQRNFEERRASLVSYWFEGYGPGGVAILIEAESDNKNRILSEIKLIMRDNDGSLGEEGSVGFLFDKLVELTVDGITNEEQLRLIDFGVSDIFDDRILVPIGFEVGRLGLEILSSRIVARPKVKISIDDTGPIEQLIDALEENEEVVSVYTNGEL